MLFSSIFTAVQLIFSSFSTANVIHNSTYSGQKQHSWEDIPTTAIELHVQSAGVSEEEQIFHTEEDDETEEQILQRKKEARDHTANQLPDISFEKFTKHKSGYHNFSTLRKLSYTNSIAVEQNSLRLKILRESYSETILLQDNCYQHYCSQMVPVAGSAQLGLHIADVQAFVPV